MRIERFEDIDPPAVWRIEAWQLARVLTRKVYGLDAPALPFEVSSSTCWPTSEVNRSTWRPFGPELKAEGLSTGERKATRLG